VQLNIRLFLFDSVFPRNWCPLLALGLFTPFDLLSGVTSSFENFPCEVMELLFYYFIACMSSQRYVLTRWPCGWRHPAVCKV